MSYLKRILSIDKTVLGVATLVAIMVLAKFFMGSIIPEEYQSKFIYIFGAVVLISSFKLIPSDA